MCSRIGLLALVGALAGILVAKPVLLMIPVQLLQSADLLPLSFQQFVHHELSNPTNRNPIFARVLASAFEEGNGKLVPWMLGECLGMEKKDQVKTVLEIGFGPGVGVTHAAALPGVERVVGVEASSSMLELATSRWKGPDGQQARERNPAVSVQLLLNEDATIESSARKSAISDRVRARLPTEIAGEQFDVVWSQNVIYFFQDKRAPLCEWVKAVKSGGKLGVCGASYESLLRVVGGDKSERFTLVPDEELQSAMLECGVTDLQTLRQPPNLFGAVPQCIVGLVA